MSYLPYLRAEVQQVLEVAQDWMLDAVFPGETREGDIWWRVVSDPLEMLMEIALGEHGPEHAEKAERYYYDYLHCTRRTEG